MKAIMLKAILVNFNFTPTWLLHSDYDYLIYDRSDSKEYLKDFPQERIIYTENIGNVDYDKLGYLIDNYDSLPEVFLWGKTNLFKYITRPEFDKIKENQSFTPLLTKEHKTYSDRLGVVCFYKGEMYYERNDSWYVANNYHFRTYGEFAQYLNLPSPPYLPFPPGGNFILTKERVHKYAVDFYIKMRETLPYTQLPSEAHMCERTYHTLWK